MTLEINENTRLANYVVADKSLETQNGRSVQATQRSVNAHDVARFEAIDGVNNVADVVEIYSDISSTDLSELLEDESIDADAELHRLDSVARSDQPRIFIAGYNGRRPIGQAEATKLLDRVEESADILIVLLSQQIATVDDHERNTEPLEWVHETMDSLSGASINHDGQLSCFGTIPVDIPTNDIEDLVGTFIDSGFPGIAIDYLGKKPTAEARVRETVTPILEKLGSHGRHREIALYAANPYRGNALPDEDHSRAEDFYAFALGHDLIGQEYYHQRRPFGDRGPPKIRLFDRHTYTDDEAIIEDIDGRLPSDSIVSPDMVKSVADDLSELLPLQRLARTEEMNKAFEELREAMRREIGKAFIDEKVGTNSRIKDQLSVAADAYNQGRSSPPLSSF